MNPRRFLNLLRSPTGALVLFLVGLVLALVVFNSRRPFGKPEAASRDDAETPGQPAPQLPDTVQREIVPYEVPNPKPERVPTVQASKPQKTEAPPELPPLSLVAESPATPTAEPKTYGDLFAPFGRLVRCELVVTVDSSSIRTPIIGLVTEDVFHHGELLVPAGTEVHGSATVDRTRERIASDGRWTLVWQTGEELDVSGLALDHEPEEESGGWSITDGSAGLRGRLIKSDSLAEVKLYAAALLSGAADAFTDRSVSDFGSFALPSLQNAPLSGAKSVLDRYSQQILQAIERDGFFVRVPAGKEFYLYITQTLDRADARIGGSARGAGEEPANAERTRAQPRPQPEGRVQFRESRHHAPEPTSP